MTDKINQQVSFSYRGVLCLLSSAFCFALSTVFAKLVTNGSAILGVEITFFRFIFGFLAMAIFIRVRPRSLHPVNFKYILLRAISNAIAVLLFFSGIQYTTVTNANMLNMTYPVFVLITAPLINRERGSKGNYFFMVLTICGIYLIVKPDFSGINPGDLMALGSGIVASIAIATLREARKFDDSVVILFYHMLIGTVLTFFLMLPFFVMPEGIVLFHLVLTTIASVLGQVFLTIGYRYIDATSGSLVSASRILWACGMGIIFFSDPLSSGIISGGILILISLFGVSGIWRVKSSNPPNPPEGG